MLFKKIGFLILVITSLFNVNCCFAAAMAPAQTPEFEEFIQNIIAGEEEKITQTLDQYPMFLEHSIPYSMVKSHGKGALKAMCDDSSLKALDLAIINGHFNLFKSLHQRGYFSFNRLNLSNILNVLMSTDSTEELEYMLTHSPRTEDVIIAKVMAQKRRKTKIEKWIADTFREKIEHANNKNYYIYDPPQNLPAQERTIHQYMISALNSNITEDQTKLLIGGNQWLLSAQITQAHIDSFLKYLPYVSDRIFDHLTTLSRQIEKHPDKPLSIFDFALLRQNSTMVNCLLELRPEFVNEKTSILAIAQATNNPDLIALVQTAIQKEEFKEFAQDKLLAYNALVQNDLETFERLLAGKPTLAPGPITFRIIAIGKDAIIKRCEQKGITDGIIETPDKPMTLAQAAIKRDNPKALAIISRFNVPLDAATEGGTFLHAAAAQGSLKMVKYLLAQKVNPLAVDGRGRTAHELASKNYPEIARLIKSYEKLTLKKQSSCEPSTADSITQQPLKSVEEIADELEKIEDNSKKTQHNTQPKNPGKKKKSPAQAALITLKPEAPAQQKKEKTEEEKKAAAAKKHQQNLKRQQKKEAEQKQEKIIAVPLQNEKVALGEQPENSAEDAATEKRKRKKEERKERRAAELAKQEAEFAAQLKSFADILLQKAAQQIRGEDNLVKIAQARTEKIAAFKRLHAPKETALLESHQESRTQPNQPIDPESAAQLLQALFERQEVIIDLERNYLTRKEIEKMLLERCTVYDKPLVERLLTAISSQPRIDQHASFRFENGVIEMDKLLKSYTGQETPPVPDQINPLLRNRQKTAPAAKSRLMVKR